MKRWLAWAGVVVLVVGVYTFVSNDIITPDSGEIPQEIEIISDNPQIKIESVVAGLKQPIAIESTGIVGDDRLFIAEQGGLIRVLNNAGELESAPILDISSMVINDSEQGLLGFAFDPEFSSNGFIYVNFVEPEGPTGRRTVIARYTIPSGKTQAELDSERRIMVIDQPYTNHNGGDITFGPDGNLYIATGDGGNGGDPDNYAQNIKSLLGKILRIDVTGESYNVPADNPLISAGNVRAEIWSYGWRNPWRFSFDSKGNLWVGDVGQNAIEEINLQTADQAGSSFGWRCLEGSDIYDDSECDSSVQHVPPVATYEHVEDGCGGSVTGGFVYEGPNAPSLLGWYVFGDFCTGQIYAYNPDSSDLKELLSSELSISTFGVDVDKNLYIADYSGEIFEVVGL